MRSTSYVGRQPIFDAKIDLVAYELLYRAAPAGKSGGAFPDGRNATATVLIDGILNIGLDRLVGEKPAFVNMTREYLCGEMALPFSPEQFILEVLEDITIDDALLAALTKLRAAGFRLALDDIIQWQPIMERLLPLVQYVKVDVMACKDPVLTALVKRLRAFPLILVAEKVESWEEFEQCKALGFDLYQGFFLERPRVVQSKVIPSNKLAMIQTLAKLQDPDADFHLIEQIVTADPGLSLKMLRLANSSLYGLRKKVDSIHQVIIFLGMNTIKDWISLILFNEHSDKPPSLTVTAMTRARFCQLLATRAGKSDQSRLAFTVGLFSLLDALLDRPLKEILGNLAITNDLSAALLRHEGLTGNLLAAVIAMEAGKAVEPKPGLPDLDVLQDSWLEALSWTNAMMKEIGLAAK